MENTVVYTRPNIDYATPIIIVICVIVGIILLIAFAKAFVNVRIVLFMFAMFATWVLLANFVFGIPYLPNDVINNIFYISVVLFVAATVLWIFLRERKLKKQRKIDAEIEYRYILEQVKQHNQRLSEEEAEREAKRKQEEILKRMDEFLNNKENKATKNSFYDFKMTIEQCYSFLEMPENATIEEIKKAYKELLIEFHPDKHINHKQHYEEYCQKINYAYEKICRERGI